MKQSILAVIAAAALVVASTSGGVYAGAPAQDYDVVAASLAGDFEALDVEQGDSCAGTLTDLLDAKGKIKHVQAGGDGNVIYTLEGKSKSVAVVVCGDLEL